MGTERVIPIDQVPKDFDELAMARLRSPLHHDLTVPYGKKQVQDQDEEGNPIKKWIPTSVVVPGMRKVENKIGKRKITKWEYVETKPVKLAIAMHIAKHVAQAYLREEHMRKIEKEEDEAKRKILMEQAIPNFIDRRFELIKKIVVEEETMEVKEQQVEL